MSNKQRKYEILNCKSEHGKSSIDIECPFCGEITEAFIWSMSGSGKRCHGYKCDAIFFSSGNAELRPKPKRPKYGDKPLKLTLDDGETN